MAFISPGIESDRNGSMPVSSWKSDTPSENWSELPVTGRPSSCSGAMKEGEPSTMPVRVAWLSAKRATPKSMMRIRRLS
jgi:hypothetical protein